MQAEEVSEMTVVGPLDSGDSDNSKDDCSKDDCVPDSGPPSPDVHPLPPFPAAQPSEDAPEKKQRGRPKRKQLPNLKQHRKKPSAVSNKVVQHLAHLNPVVDGDEASSLLGRAADLFKSQLNSLIAEKKELQATIAKQTRAIEEMLATNETLRATNEEVKARFKEYEASVETQQQATRKAFLAEIEQARKAAVSAADLMEKLYDTHFCF